MARNHLIPRFLLVRASLVGPLVALAACSGPAAQTPKDTAAIPVALAAAVSSNGNGNVVAAGTVRLKRETEMSFNTGGRIAAITVREGDRIARGQVLARLDVTGLDAAFSSARAEAQRADADYGRAKDLFDKGWVTAPRVETARASALAARARVRQSGFDLGLATLRAPGPGVVLARPAEPGQIVGPGQAVLTIGEQAGGHVLRVPMADGDAARLRIGQPAQVRLPAIGVLPARVSEIGARSDTGTGTFRVELKLPDDARLRSGLIGSASFTLPGPAGNGGTVSVPASAVFGARADEGFVYVHDASGGKVRLRQVAVGTVGDGAVTITSGLQVGEMVAVTGTDRLRDGIRVIVRPQG